MINSKLTNPDLINYPKNFHDKLYSVENLKKSIENHEEIKNLIPLFEKLKKSGKVVLLTNGNAVSTHSKLLNILGENYSEIFDFLIAKAKKPIFFDKDNFSSFESLENTEIKITGSLNCLQKIFESEGVELNKVYLFEDSIFDGVLMPRILKRDLEVYFIDRYFESDKVEIEKYNSLLEENHIKVVESLENAVKKVIQENS